MALHKTLTLPDLHQAKIPQGLAAARPATPAGIGDIYWATDTGVLSLTNAAGTTWVNFSGGSVSLDDLTDVVITGVSTNQVLKYDGTNWINSSVGLGEIAGVAPFTQALGDMLVSDGADMIALTVGANNQVLTADNTQPLGVRWANSPVDYTDTLVALSGW